MLTGEQSKSLVFLKNRCRDLETKRYFHKEICTLLQEIAQITPWLGNRFHPAAP
jgi:hypothetical protein